MKNTMQGLLAVFVLAFGMCAQAASTPFKTTYDELFEEFPNFKAELKDVPPLSQGNQRKGGSVKVGTGLMLFEAEGKNPSKLELFSVGLMVTGETSKADSARLDELANVFVHKLARTDKAYWQTRMFMDQEVKRQLSVLGAGGTPKPGHKDFGQTRLTISINRSDSLVSVIYSFKRIG